MLRAEDQLSFSAPRWQVLLLAPYAPLGGGMGQLAAYMLGAENGAFHFKPVETRGSKTWRHAAPHMVRAIIQLVCAKPRTVVHAHMADGGSVWRKGLLLLLARLSGHRTVLHLHGAEIIAQWKSYTPVQRIALRSIFRRASLCIVLGSCWQDWVRDALGVPEKRLAILWNGVPFPDVADTTDPEPGHLAFMGNLLPRKGLPDLLAALATDPLRRRAWRLTVAGGGSAQAAAKVAQQLGMSERVYFCGWLERSAILKALQRASALILPSYSEGLPLVLLEACALGVPIITTSVGSIPEVFENGVTALLVKPGDVKALADAIERVLRDKTIRDTLSANGRALYAEKFTFARFFRDLEHLYDTRLPAP